jgi:hypothetical protein
MELPAGLGNFGKGIGGTDELDDAGSAFDRDFAGSESRRMG